MDPLCVNGQHSGSDDFEGFSSYPPYVSFACACDVSQSEAGFVSQLLKHVRTQRRALSSCVNNGQDASSRPFDSHFVRQTQILGCTAHYALRHSHDRQKILSR